MAELYAWTDGACSGNPGPGGWGVLMRAMNGHTIARERTLKGGAFETTNNRMELLAAINALEALTRPSRITIISDAKYLTDGATDWIHGWKRNGWKRSRRSKQQDHSRNKTNAKPVKNVDLWQRLDAAQSRHQVKWQWIKGHAGNPGNERADALAREGMALFMANDESLVE